jgi:hypothetical protein
LIGNFAIRIPEGEGRACAGERRVVVDQMPSPPQSAPWRGEAVMISDASELAPGSVGQGVADQSTTGCALHFMLAGRSGVGRLHLGGKWHIHFHICVSGLARFSRSTRRVAALPETNVDAAFSAPSPASAYEEGGNLLYWAVVFLIIALIAAFLQSWRRWGCHFRAILLVVVSFRDHLRHEGRMKKGPQPGPESASVISICLIK